MSIIATWSVGIIPPLIIRRWVFKGPINKIKASISTVFLYLAQLMFWSVLNPTGRHRVLFFIALITYGIFHNGYDSSKGKIKNAITNGNVSNELYEEHALTSDKVEINYTQDQSHILEPSTLLDSKHVELKSGITTDSISNKGKSNYPENLSENADSTTSCEVRLDLIESQVSSKEEYMISLEERFSALQTLLYKGLISREDYDKKKKELIDSL